MVVFWCVSAEWVSPKMRLYRLVGGKDLPLLVYLHGGGWVIGGIASCSAFRRAVRFAVEAWLRSGRGD